MANIRERKENHCRGAMAAEAALVFPVILLVTFGAIRYGWFYLKAQQITNASRYGARVAIRADASTQNVLDAISALLGPNGAKILAVNDASPYVTFKVNGESSGNINPPNGDDIQMGDSITVTISIPRAYVDILPVGLFDFDSSGDPTDPNSPHIVASVTMAKEGF